MRLNFGGYFILGPNGELSPIMQKISEATGLTGSALLIYVIVSEGSRLFPPRNLVPLP